MSSVGFPSKSVLSWDDSCLWKSVSTCICPRGQISRQVWPGCPVPHRLHSSASYLNSESSEPDELSSWTLASTLKSPLSGRIFNISLQRSSHSSVFPREQFSLAYPFVSERRGTWSQLEPPSPWALSLSICWLTIPSLSGPVCVQFTSTTQSGSKTAMPLLGTSIWWPWPSALIGAISRTGQRWICREKTSETGSVDGEEAAASNSAVTN